VGFFPIFLMPFEHNSYYSRGSFSRRTISRQSRAVYDRTRDSTRLNPCPYPSPAAISLRMEDGQDWYHHPGSDLHLSDLLFQARIQTARRMSQRVELFPNRDRVLERLMAEGVFDRRAPDHVGIGEERAMWLSVAMTERVLERVENLESRVCLWLSPLNVFADFFLDRLPSFPVGCS